MTDVAVLLEVLEVVEDALRLAPELSRGFVRDLC